MALSQKPAAFLVVSGALANLLAVMSLAERGTQVVMERRCHLYWARGECRSIRDGRYGYAQKTSMLCLEKHGAQSVYVDGARLWNAAVALDIPVHSFLMGVDAAMLSLNKGVGAPVGAVLVGSEEFVERARTNAKRVGAYSVHRMGLFAAAAFAAFDTLDERLRADHRRAKVLAEGLSRLEGIVVDLETVQTNIVRMEVTAPALDGEGFVRGLADRGIGARLIQLPRTVKFNTYSGISDADIEKVLVAIDEVLNGSVKKGNTFQTGSS